MYLTGREYVKDWNHNYENNEIPKTTPAKKIAKACGIDWPVSEVVFSLAYWRKVNAIHSWFVDNVQEGNDDCKEYYVDREKLVELRSIVNDILSGAIKPEEALPTAAGFFFGNTNYDEWYMHDMKDTHEMLDKILSDPKLEDISFYYQSSW